MYNLIHVVYNCVLRMYNLLVLNKNLIYNHYLFIFLYEDILN